MYLPFESNPVESKRVLPMTQCPEYITFALRFPLVRKHPAADEGRSRICGKPDSAFIKKAPNRFHPELLALRLPGPVPL